MCVCESKKGHMKHNFLVGEFDSFHFNQKAETYTWCVYVCVYILYKRMREKKCVCVCDRACLDWWSTSI